MQSWVGKVILPLFSDVTKCTFLGSFEPQMPTGVCWWTLRVFSPGAQTLEQALHLSNLLQNMNAVELQL